MGRRPNNPKLRKSEVNHAYPLILEKVKAGIDITKAISEAGLTDFIFYKYATLDQKSELRAIKMQKVSEDLLVKDDFNKYFLSSLKDYFENPPKVLMKRKDRVEYIINGVCLYYKMPLSELQRVYRKKNLQKRRMAMKLLYEAGDCALIDISSPLGYRDTFLSGINTHINILNEEMRGQNKRAKELRDEYENIKKFLGI